MESLIFLNLEAVAVNLPPDIIDYIPCAPRDWDMVRLKGIGFELPTRGGIPFAAEYSFSGIPCKNIIGWFLPFPRGGI